MTALQKLLFLPWRISYLMRFGLLGFVKTSTTVAHFHSRYCMHCPLQSLHLKQASVGYTCNSAVLRFVDSIKVSLIAFHTRRKMLHDPVLRAFIAIIVCQWHSV